MNQAAGIELESAVRWFVADARDDFFPDPIQYRDVLSELPIFVRKVLQHSNHRPDPVLRFGVPKGGELFQRDATWLSPAFRAVYLSELKKLLPDLGPKLHSSCYSYRPVIDGQQGSPFRNPVKQWTLFNNRFREELLDDDGWGVVTDIASFYETVAVDNLVKTVFGLLPTEREKILRPVASRLRSLLDWASRGGVGIPQNNEGSSFLCTMLLSPVDGLMASSHARYFRYVDDIRLVARTKAEAINAFHLLQAQLRSMGLTLNSAKTKLISPRSSDWYRCVDIELDSLLGRVDSALESPTSELALEVVGDLLRRFLASSKTGALSREVRALGARVMRIARIPSLRQPCLAALTEVGLRGFATDPAGSESWCRFLSLAPTADTAKELLSLLSDSDANRHPWTNGWMLAVMSRCRSLSGISMDYLRTTALNVARHPIERSWALLGLGKLGTNTERRRIASQVSSADAHPQIQRSALLATQELPEKERAAFFRTLKSAPVASQTLARYLSSLERPIYDVFDAKLHIEEHVDPIGRSIGLLGGRIRRFTSAGASVDYD